MMHKTSTVAATLMNETQNITLDRGWLVTLRDLGIDPEDVLLRAQLPLEVLHRETSRLSIAEFFGLIDAADRVADDPLLALRFGQAASPELFSPPIFAALCSPTLVAAVKRIATHKRLVAPINLTVQETGDGLVINWAWDDPTITSPRLLVGADLVFITQLARIATREPIKPHRVTSPVELAPADAFADFFGVTPTIGPQSITFTTTDAYRPFLTASDDLWASFEPELKRRTSKLDAQMTMIDKTNSILLECLPSGEAALEQTAHRLGVSPRTLQRRLNEEGATFRQLVKATRQRLAQHYLMNTSLPYQEIAFLLGFDEPSSFFRAFHAWSGKTPDAARNGAR